MGYILTILISPTNNSDLDSWMYGSVVFSQLALTIVLSETYVVQLDW